MTKEQRNLQVVTPTETRYFAEADDAIEYAAAQRILRNGPAEVFVATVDGDWMEVDW